MTKTLHTIFTYGEGNGGPEIEVAVDDNNRLHVNGDPIVTESRVTFDLWVIISAVVVAGSTAILAIVEVSRVATCP